MCGIVGFIAKNKNNFDTNKIKILMLYNESRGEDSSGYYTPSSGTVKRLGKVSSNLLFEGEFKPDTIFIGHTRKASGVSKKTLDTAHPFDFEDFVYAHNGTLTYLTQTCAALGFPYSQVDVDSILIGKSFQKHSKPKDAIGELYGVANILMYFKDTPNTLNVYKHKDRPLFRGESPEGLYISSIEESLKTIGCEKIKEFSDGYWYTITDGVVNAPLAVKMNEYSYQSTTPTTAEWYKFSTGFWAKTKHEATSMSGKIKLKANMYHKIDHGLTSGSDTSFSVTQYKGNWFKPSDFETPKFPTDFDVCYVLGESGGKIEGFRVVFVLKTNIINYYTRVNGTELMAIVIDTDELWVINTEKDVDLSKVEKIPVGNLLPLTITERNTRFNGAANASSLIDSGKIVNRVYNESNKQTTNTSSSTNSHVRSSVTYMYDIDDHVKITISSLGEDKSKIISGVWKITALSLNASKPSYSVTRIDGVAHFMHFIDESRLIFLSDWDMALAKKNEEKENNTDRKVDVEDKTLSNEQTEVISLYNSFETVDASVNKMINQDLDLREMGTVISEYKSNKTIFKAKLMRFIKSKSNIELNVKE